MTAEPVCPHNPKFKPSNCVECMMEGNLPPIVPEKLHVQAVFPAQYVGHCYLCEFTWGVGTEIARLSDETYVHHKCATEAGL